jgi:hypothetical protein
MNVHRAFWKISKYFGIMCDFKYFDLKNYMDWYLRRFDHLKVSLAFSRPELAFMHAYF